MLNNAFGMAKFHLLILIILLTTSTTYGQFAGGNGTEENPYEISTIDDLQEVINHTDAHFIQTNDIDAGETEQWNEGKGFEPINNFTGSYNGNGYKINDLTIDRPEGSRASMFQSVLQSGVLKNIHTRNVQIRSSSGAAGITGINYGVITHSSATGTAKADRKAGGIAGRNDASGEIHQSFASVDVTSNIDRAGGFVGQNNGLIKNAYAMGTVKGVGPNNHMPRSGGFVGTLVEGSIINSYASGKVIGQNPSLGGFYGFITEAKIINSYWNTETSSQSGNSSVPDDSEVSLQGLTVAEMIQKEVFGDWDFDTVWQIKEGAGQASYPYLIENEPDYLPGSIQHSSFGSVTPGLSKKITIEITNPTDKQIEFSGYDFISTPWNWLDEFPEYLTAQNNFEAVVGPGQTHEFELEWSPDSNERDLDAIFHLVHNHPELHPDFFRIHLKGTISAGDGEDLATISAPKYNERLLTDGVHTFRATIHDDSINENDLCWSSDKDGQLGCGAEISVTDLSEGNHSITLESSESSDTIPVRFYPDLWELYQSEPAPAEVDRIFEDFNIIYVTGDIEDRSWDSYGFEFDQQSLYPSRMTIISKLDILRRQRFTEPPTFIGEYETVYDWAKSTINTIEMRLDCGSARGGGGNVSFPLDNSLWGILDGTKDCTIAAESSPTPRSYNSALSLFVHEVRHSEPDDPRHFGKCEDRSSDLTLEDGSGYAWMAKYNMWVYAYSLHDPKYVQDSSESSARLQLASICGEERSGEPKHSNPAVETVVDEIIGTAQEPGRVKLDSPGKDDDEIDLLPELNWIRMPGTFGYELQISKDPNMGDPVINLSEIDHTTYRVESELNVNSQYFWRVRSTNDMGEGDWSETWSFETGTTTDTPDEKEIPDEFSLKQNYPNPFNPVTRIGYELPETVEVTLEVFNLLGEQVAVLVNEQQPAGTYQVRFDGSELSSGVYLYRLRAGDYVETHQMMFIK